MSRQELAKLFAQIIKYGFTAKHLLTPNKKIRFRGVNKPAQTYMVDVFGTDLDTPLATLYIGTSEKWMAVNFNNRLRPMAWNPDIEATILEFLTFMEEDYYEQA